MFIYNISYIAHLKYYIAITSECNKYPAIYNIHAIKKFH